MKSVLATLILAAGLLLASPAQSGGTFTIDWYSIDGGGVMQSSSDDWELSGTVGQPDASSANELAGGGWHLTGGFWGLISEFLEELFSDRFEQP